MYKFIIDSNLPTLNEYIDAERRGLHLAAAMKKRFTGICSQYSLGLPKRIQGCFDVIFKFYRSDNRHDSDNVFFGKKFILDGMVQSGVLPSDGRKMIRHNIDLIYLSPNKKNFVVVELIPIEKSPLESFSKTDVNPSVLTTK